MSNRTLATQAELQLLKDTLNQMAENLRAHADLPLGKAHGIQLLTGFVDSFGNDLTTYQDSNGDIVGDKFIAFAINGAVYYAPGRTSALAGQNSTVDAIADSSAAAAGTLGGTSLVTDYTSLEVQHAVNVNSLLLEHTLKSHDAAHLQTSAFLKTTSDSSGHTVGRYVVQLTIGGIVYEFPADTRFGGPPQAVVGTITPPAATSSGSSLPLSSVLFTFNFVRGTKPYTLTWQVNALANGTSPIWLDLSGSSGSVTSQNNFALNYAGADTVILTVSASSLNGIDNQTVSPAFTIRALVNNAAGASTAATARLDAYDKTSSSIIFSSSYIAGFMTRQQFLDMLRYRLRHQSRDRFGRQTWAGYMLLFYQVALRIRRGDWLAWGLYQLFPAPFCRYAKWRMGERHLPVFSLILSKLFEWASLLAYCARPRRAEEIAAREEKRGTIRQYVQHTERLRQFERRKYSEQRAEESLPQL